LSIKVRFQRLAAREAQAAEDWYRDRSLDAASRFRDSVNAATTRIMENRTTHSIGTTKYRYVRVKGFPYRLIYRQEDALTAFVVAVAHDRRRPGYWLRRT
jgi:hypothetical protein